MASDMDAPLIAMLVALGIFLVLTIVGLIALIFVKAKLLQRLASSPRSTRS